MERSLMPYIKHKAKSYKSEYQHCSYASSDGISWISVPTIDAPLTVIEIEPIKEKELESGVVISKRKFNLDEQD